MPLTFFCHGIEVELILSRREFSPFQILYLIVNKCHVTESNQLHVLCATIIRLHKGLPTSIFFCQHVGEHGLMNIKYLNCVMSGYAGTGKV